MAFLDEVPDMTGFVYPRKFVQESQKYLLSVIRNLDPDWLDAPQGLLALYWKGTGAHSSAYLSYVARLIYDLERNCSEKSTVVLRGKVLELLRQRNLVQAEQLLFELEVGRHLAFHGGVVSFEPLVPAELAESAVKPSSPDYGVRVLGFSDTTIEVTTLQLGFLTKWDAAMQQVMRTLQARALRREYQLQVTFVVPITLEGPDFELISARTTVALFDRSPEGEEVLRTPHGDVDIKWQPLLHLREDENGEVVIDPAPAPFSSAFGFSWSFSYDEEEILKRITTSLISTIDGKRTQRLRGAPFMLALRVPPGRVPPQVAVDLLLTRVLTNKKYSFLSAVMIVTFDRSFAAGSGGGQNILVINELAKFPLPPSLRNSLGGIKAIEA